MFTGCKKTEDNPIISEDVVLSDDDAANTIAGAMGASASTNGFAGQLENAVRVASGGTVAGPLVIPANSEAVLFDTTITKSKTGASYSYNYVMTFSYTFTNLGNTCNFAYTANGNCQTPRLTVSDTANASLVVKNIINTAASNYSINGTYQRKGNTVSKIGNLTSFNSNLVVTLDSVTVGKTTKQINGGSATLTITGSNSAGKSFTKTAILYFLGNTQFKLLINGKEYLLDPATAFANKN